MRRGGWGCGGGGHGRLGSELGGDLHGAGAMTMGVGLRSSTGRKRGGYYICIYKWVRPPAVDPTRIRAQSDSWFGGVMCGGLGKKVEGGWGNWGARRVDKQRTRDDRASGHSCRDGE